MGRWDDLRAQNGIWVIVESDDDVLSDQITRDRLKEQLATAPDEWVAEQKVKDFFKATHDIENGHAEFDRSLDQVPVVVTVKLTRRS